MHPDHVITKSGILTAPFLEEYAKGNRTTKNRIDKYTERGYKIGFKNEDMLELMNNGVMIPIEAPKSFFTNERINKIEKKFLGALD